MVTTDSSQFNPLQDVCLGTSILKFTTRDSQQSPILMEMVSSFLQRGKHERRCCKLTAFQSGDFGLAKRRRRVCFVCGAGNEMACFKVQRWCLWRHSIHHLGAESHCGIWQKQIGCWSWQCGSDLGRKSYFLGKANVERAYPFCSGKIRPNNQSNTWASLLCWEPSKWRTHNWTQIGGICSSAIFRGIWIQHGNLDFFISLTSSSPSQTMTKTVQ